jgi:glycosyltransferase involved in cell wall biosynthesis
MTILHVSTPADWRGGEQQVAYLAIALQSMGIEQVVLCPQGSVLATRMIEASVPVATFDKRGFMNMLVARKIFRLSKVKSFAIIHCHDAHAHSAAVVAAVHYGVKSPVIVSRRVDFPVSSNPLSRWKYNHPSVRRILCVSQAISDITAPAIKDVSKLTVVHSGIDLQKYMPGSRNRKLIHELGLDASSRIVGNLSALADHKDYPTFIRTAEKVIHADPLIHFIIAGKGREEKRIKKLINDLKLNMNVHMLGFRDDIIEVMQSLDVFLITSATEGLGTIVLDAFAAGVPVVATRAGGIPEMVEDGVTGLLAPVGDADALATATLRILNQPDLGKALANDAFQKVQEFSYQTTAEKTLMIYRSIEK